MASPRSGRLSANALNMSAKLIHAVILLQSLYGIYYDLSYVNFPKSLKELSLESDIIPLKGRLKFLTFWNMILQTVYFAIALLNDFVGSNENVPTKPSIVRRVKDYIFSALAFPTAMYVSITFWGIFAVDRELVFPKVLDEFFPTWLNHVMHSNIVVFILIETFICFRKYPSRRNGLTGLTIFLVAYLVWVHVIYHYSGIWVYPILNVLNLPMRIVFFLFSLVFGFGLYFIGEAINNAVWSKQLEQIKRSGRKKAK